MKPGDVVTRVGFKTRATIVRVIKRNTWPTCVKVDPPLGGYTYWDASELELSKSKQPFKKP